MLGNFHKEILGNNLQYRLKETCVSSVFIRNVVPLLASLATKQALQVVRQMIAVLVSLFVSKAWTSGFFRIRIT